MIIMVYGMLVTSWKNWFADHLFWEFMRLLLPHDAGGTLSNEDNFLREASLCREIFTVGWRYWITLVVWFGCYLWATGFARDPKRTLLVSFIRSPRGPIEILWVRRARVG